MPRRNVPLNLRPTMERHLKALEREVIRGKAALAERDALLVALYADGYSQPKLTGLLNVVHRTKGVPELTEDAVAQAIRRAQKVSDE